MRTRAFSEVENKHTPPFGRGEFLTQLLTRQCATAPAIAGAVLRVEDDGSVVAVCTVSETTHPPDQTWLARATEIIRDDRASSPVALREHSHNGLYDDERAIVTVPLPTLSGGAAWYGVYLIETGRVDAREVYHRLELSAKLVTLDETEHTLHAVEDDLGFTRRAFHVVVAAARHAKFQGAAMDICNTVASLWECDRVSIGILRDRSVRLEASSHAEKIEGRSRTAQRIEDAMDECFDQDIEVISPSDPSSEVIARVHDELTRASDVRSNVLSLPIRDEGSAIGVLTAEKPANDPFETREIEAMRLAIELIARPLALLHQRALPVHRRFLRSMRSVASGIVGPRHTWAKLTAIASIAFLLYTTLAHTSYTVGAPFRTEPAALYLLPAPFDGHLRHVYADVDDDVISEGTLLAEMDVDRLRLERTALVAEREIALRKQRQARNESKAAEALMSDAEVDRLDAQIAQIDADIARASITSPVSGRILHSDLKSKVGAPISMGDTLFEIAEGDELRIDVYVDEKHARDIHADQRGELATAAYPSRRIGFIVLEIDPAAQVHDGRNVFRVRASLDERPGWIKPGMEGVARIDIDRRTRMDIWTRPIIDWIRMKLWI